MLVFAAKGRITSLKNVDTWTSRRLDSETEAALEKDFSGAESAAF